MVYAEFRPFFCLNGAILHGFERFRRDLKRCEEARCLRRVCGKNVFLELLKVVSVIVAAFKGSFNSLLRCGAFSVRILRSKFTKMLKNTRKVDKTHIYLVKYNEL